MSEDCRGKASVKIKDDTSEGTIEFEGTDVFVNGVRIAKRKGKKWVSLLPGVTVRDIKKKQKGDRTGIEIIYSGRSGIERMTGGKPRSSR
jgi:hypothetical protein